MCELWFTLSDDGRLKTVESGNRTQK